MRLLLACLLSLLLASVAARAAEPFFKKGDVIALVGGEDMVVASEYGYLELLLVRALPDYRLRFRNLAWEGDTVFEQRRDLGFPTWEEQLDKIGATVVIAQFGQMESLAGKGERRKAKGDGGSKEKIAEFLAAYAKLIERFSGGGKRRVVIFPAFAFAQSRPDTQELAKQLEPASGLQVHNPLLREYLTAIHEAAPRWKVRILDISQIGLVHTLLQRDGAHLTEDGHRGAATRLGLAMALPEKIMFPNGLGIGEKHDALRQLIVAKNRLWFDYWRPQNWAFLAGDRTAQPSSRDHLDPSKRWFPPEREAFLPLIEAKEKEIDALAAQLAQP